MTNTLIAILTALSLLVGACELNDPYPSLEYVEGQTYEGPTPWEYTTPLISSWYKIDADPVRVVWVKELCLTGPLIDGHFEGCVTGMNLRFGVWVAQRAPRADGQHLHVADTSLAHEYLHWVLGQTTGDVQADHQDDQLWREDLLQLNQMLREMSPVPYSGRHWGQGVPDAPPQPGKSADTLGITSPSLANLAQVAIDNCGTKKDPS